MYVLHIFIDEVSANQFFSFHPLLLPTSHSSPLPLTATLPGDIPLQILLLQKYLKSSFDIIGFLAPEIALQILSKLSVQEVVGAGLVSVFLGCFMMVCGMFEHVGSALNPCFLRYWSKA
jgi:hypothetical protein